MTIKMNIAIGEIRMISPGEANIRKIAGISVATAIAIYQRISPSTLPAGFYFIINPKIRAHARSSTVHVHVDYTHSTLWNELIE